MNPTKRQIESQLKLLSSEAGLDLDTPSHWIIENIDNPLLFFHNLATLVKFESVLYFECLDIAPEASAFYESKQSSYREPIIRDLVFPIPIIYHIRFSREFTNGMAQLIPKYARETLFTHIKCYCDKHIIFTFHDAFNGSLRISTTVSEASVAMFCKALQCGYALENTEPRDPLQMLKLLSALQREAPDKVTKSWWRRFSLGL